MFFWVQLTTQIIILCEHTLQWFVFLHALPSETSTLKSLSLSLCVPRVSAVLTSQMPHRNSVWWDSSADTPCAR